MKKHILSLCLLAVLMLTACGAVCQHRDSDDNSRCDKCDESYTDGKDVYGELCQHRDANDDSLCDKCAEAYVDGKDLVDGDNGDSSLFEFKVTETSCEIVRLKNKTVNRVVIPDYVTSIGHGAFSVCDNLTSVTIPASVTSISESAFSRCKNLESITVDESNNNYKSIDGVLYTKDGTTLLQYSFGKTDESFTVPDGVTSITGYAFYDCRSLTSITIPDSVTYIERSAFFDCSNLVSLTIPAMAISCFTYSDKIQTVVITSGDSIVFNAFWFNGKNLTSVTIPDSVTSIDNCAFKDCTSLTSITIPASVTTLGLYVFEGCSSLTIYCEATEQPSGWSSSWNPDNCPVVWGCAGEEK